MGCPKINKSTKHKQMIELLAAAYVVGMVQVGPNMMKTDYINENHQIITVTEVIQETPEAVTR